MLGYKGLRVTPICNDTFTEKDIGKTMVSVKPQSKTSPDGIPRVKSAKRWWGANSTEGTCRWNCNNLELLREMLSTKWGDWIEASSHCIPFCSQAFSGLWHCQGMKNNTVAQGLNWTICLTSMLSKDNVKCLLLIRMTLSGSVESYIYWNMGFPYLFLIRKKIFYVCITSKCLKRTLAMVFLQSVEQSTDSQITTRLSRGLTRRYLKMSMIRQRTY